MEASEVQVDFVRKDRIGIAEAVFCLQKNVKQIEVILEESKKNGGSILLTRLSEEKYLTLRPETLGEMDYDPLSETGFHCLDASQKNQEPAKCVIIAAGTSDARVAREAMRTLEFNGIQAHIIIDVGVAGIWSCWNGRCSTNRVGRTGARSRDCPSHLKWLWRQP